MAYSIEHFAVDGRQVKLSQSAISVTGGSLGKKLSRDHASRDIMLPWPMRLTSEKADRRGACGVLTTMALMLVYPFLHRQPPRVLKTWAKLVYSLDWPPYCDGPGRPCWESGLHSDKGALIRANHWER